MPHVRFRGERAPMTEERLVKIAGILGTNLLTESHVQHLFVLARKLIETLPAVERRSLEPLKFYCDWTLHAEMDHGPAVARLIRANRIVSEHIEHGLDVKRFVNDLLAILSLEEARAAFNSLLEQVSPSNHIRIEASRWREIGWHLAEIVSECPIKISAERMWRQDIQDLLLAIPFAFVSEISIVRGSGPDLGQPGFSIRLKQSRGEALMTFVRPTEL